MHPNPGCQRSYEPVGARNFRCHTPLGYSEPRRYRPAPDTEAIVSSPSHGTVGVIDATTGTVAYTPTKGFTGADSFAYEAMNVAGPSNVAVATVTVVVAPTTVRTGSATGVGQTRAVLRGAVTPGTGTTTAQFEYSTRRTLARATATRLQSVPSGVGMVPISATLSGLTPSTTYYYRLRALNSTTGATPSGSVRRFTTARPSGRVDATMPWTFDPHGRYVTVSQLVVNDAPVGGRIVIGCQRPRLLAEPHPQHQPAEGSVQGETRHALVRKAGLPGDRRPHTAVRPRATRVRRQAPGTDHQDWREIHGGVRCGTLRRGRFPPKNFVPGPGERQDGRC